MDEYITTEITPSPPLKELIVTHGKANPVLICLYPMKYNCVCTSHLLSIYWN